MIDQTHAAFVRVVNHVSVSHVLSRRSQARILVNA